MRRRELKHIRSILHEDPGIDVITLTDNTVIAIGQDNGTLRVGLYANRKAFSDSRANGNLVQTERTRCKAGIPRTFGYRVVADGRPEKFAGEDGFNSNYTATIEGLRAFSESEIDTSAPIKLLITDHEGEIVDTYER